MANTDFKTVDEYLASLPAPSREALAEVREIVRRAAPAAAETISYQMPAYRLNGLMLYFAGFKAHYSLFCPQPERLLEAFHDELARYHVHKSTIQFPLTEGVPTDLIRRLVEHRAAEFAARKPSRRRAAKPA